MASKHDGLKDFVLDQLSELQGLTCRAMFGGYGLYCGRVFFGIVQKGRLYFKTNSTTAPRYRERKMKPFRPNAKQTLKNYYEVPVNVLEDAGELTIWARQATPLMILCVAQAQQRPIPTPASCRTTQLCVRFSSVGRRTPDTEEFVANSPFFSRRRSATDAAKAVGTSRVYRRLLLTSHSFKF